MKKNLVLVCAAIMLTLCFSATSALALKEKCIALSMLEAGDNQTDDMIVWLDAEGWFVVLDGGEGEGAWVEYGGSFAMQFMYDCAPLLAGRLKRGFWECTGGQFEIGEFPAGSPVPEGYNSYTIKKIKKKICTEMMDEPDNETASGDSL